MPAISGGDLTALLTVPQTVKRYLSISTRESIYTARINGTPSQDAVTKGYYRIPYDGGSGTLGDVEPGMMLDIGTAAGLADVGCVRIRKVPDGSYFYIAETGANDFAIRPADNHYLTVRMDFPLVSVKPRFVSTRSGTNYVNSFIEYQDYDVSYSLQNYEVEPVVNVTYQPAGMVDPGEDYRTVEFDTELILMGIGAASATYDWDVIDGTITVGTSASQNITATFPASATFRWVKLTVTDDLGAVRIKRFPLWVHDADHMPITNFNVLRDLTSAGRDMTLELYGPIDSYDSSVLPRGALLCYWEVPEFNGQTIPETYRNYFLGWSKTKLNLLRLHESRLRLEILGPASWLNNFQGFVQTINDKSSPGKWHEMNTVSIDRTLHYLLRRYTTFLSLFNFHPSLHTAKAKAESIKPGTIWAQIADLAKAISASVGCDSSGALWVRQHLSYLEVADRSSRETIVALHPQHWRHASGLEVTEETTPRYGLVKSTGSAFSTDPSVPLESWAPGLTPGEGSDTDDLPFQRLPSSNPQTALNRLVGHHRARLNRVYQDASITLVLNLDVIEPAWNEPVSITWEQGSVSGLEISSALFLPVSVSIQHSNEPRQASKVISITLELVTAGVPGEAIPPPATSNDTDDYPIPSIVFPEFQFPPLFPLSPWDLTGIVVPVKLFAIGTTAGEIFRGTQLDLSAGSVNWESIGSGVSGIGISGCADPFNYFRRFVITRDGLWRRDDIWDDSTSWVQVADEEAITGTAGLYPHKILMSINKKGWICCPFGSQSMAISFDYGATWTQISIAGSVIDTGVTSPAYQCDVAVSSHNSDDEGWLIMTYYAFSGDNYVLYSDDWGVTLQTRLQVTNGSHWQALRLDVPYTYDGHKNLNGPNHVTYLHWEARIQKLIGGNDSVQTLVSGHDPPIILQYDNDLNVSCLLQATSYTLDGMISWKLGQHGTSGNEAGVIRSVDGWQSYEHLGTAFAPGGASVLGSAGINGYPTLPDFALVWGNRGNGSSGRLRFTDNAGLTWNSLEGGLAMTQLNCVYLEGDLSDAIPNRG